MDYHYRFKVTITGYGVVTAETQVYVMQKIRLEGV